VGIIQGPREQVSDCDVVVAMLQSLVLRDYASDIFSDFGTMLLDEAHHLAARLFSEVFFRVPARYVLGLTATPRRKDGLTSLLHDFMGPFCFQKHADGCDLRVRVLRIHISVLRPRTDELAPWEIAKLRTRLGGIPARNDAILRVLDWCVERHRRTLLLSDRLDHLRALLQRFGQRHPTVASSLYIGGMRSSAREEAEKCQVILATFAMASEGLDIPSLDTLLLAAPASDIVQAVGRVLRPCATKQDPVVLDFSDDACLAFLRAAETRRAHYRRQSFQVSEVGCHALESSIIDNALLATPGGEQQQEATSP
jgi:superfamily II DNA or RNA helicase